jgi:hypothetical protein
MTGTQQPASAEPIWAVHKGDRWLKAELFPDSRGYEVRFSSDGHCFASYSVPSRDLALRYAGVIHGDLLADGWVKTTRRAPDRPN